MAPEMEATRRQTVLIVDDDVQICRGLARALRLEGYDTAHVHDGIQALGYLRGNPPPLAILLDLMMPNMDGWGFSREKQKDSALAAIPVVVMSARGKIAETAASIPAVAYLEKPFDLDVLTRTLEETCR